MRPPACSAAPRLQPNVMQSAGSESSAFVAAFDGRTRYGNDAISVSGGAGQGFAVEMYEVGQGKILREVFPPTQVRSSPAQNCVFEYLSPLFFRCPSRGSHLAAVCPRVPGYRPCCRILRHIPLARPQHPPRSAQRRCARSASCCARFCCGGNSA